MFYQVVHSTPGRCRIRVSRLQDSEFAETLHRFIRSLPFVTDIRLNTAAYSLVIAYPSHRIDLETAEEKLCHCIEEAIAQFQDDSSDTTPFETDPFGEESDLIPLVNQWKDLGMPALSLSLAVLAAPLELPPLLVGAAIAGAAMPWFVRATDSIVTHRHPNIDLLDSAWMTLQALRGQFVAPALKTVLVETRRTLRGTVTQSHEAEALSLLNCFNQIVLVERQGQLRSISAHELQPGDRLFLQAGHTIPVDGQIIAGQGLLDMQNLINHKEPIACSPGDEVFAASQLISGELWIEVLRTGDNTRIGLAIHIMRSTPVHDTHIGAQQAEFVKNSIVPTLLLGGAIFATTGNVGAALSPYQFDFGSGIPITISTTLLAALNHAARNGVFIRSGRALEALSQIDVVVFDHRMLVEGNIIPADRLATITTLQQQGIATYLLSHDRWERAIAIADQCHIPADHILSDAELHHQTHLIHGLRSHGKTVVFVGGISQCHAGLASAHVSVTFAHNNITQETGDIVLLTPDLRGLLYARAIAQRAMEVLYQNTALITIPNLLMQIAGGMVLGVNPVYNVIVNNGSAFLAEFLNGTHPHFETLRHPADSRNNNSSLAALPSGSPALSFPTIEANAIALPAERPHTQPIRLSLKQIDLAKRLNVTSQSLTHYRSRSTFPQWSQERDPDRLAWQYDAATKQFIGL